MLNELKSIATLYSWQFPRHLMAAYREHQSNPWRLLGWFFQTRTYKNRYGAKWKQDEPVVLLFVGLMLGLIASGVVLLYQWALHGHAGYWAFGVALIIAYPFIEVLALVVVTVIKKGLWYILHPKKFGRDVVAHILEAQVKQLRRRHSFKVVAVAGSVGKTSTKLAVANLLGQTLRVRHQTGNYNDRITVPLVLFDKKEPSLLNLFAWIRLFGELQASVHHPYPYDVVVVELGTDGPGQMEQFAYLKPDITVLTAITPEHMEYFGTLDAVASEEMEIFDYSKKVLVNGDDIPGVYLGGREFAEYSLVTNVAHNYYAEPSKESLEGQTLRLEFPSGKMVSDIHFVGHQGAKFAVAAAAAADMLGVAHRDIIDGLQRLEAFAGRMQILFGKEGSRIIDDTYNATPIAVKAALDVLYAHKAPQRIAILGSMNELGDFAHEAHTEVGDYCDVKKLDMVVTVGHDAERWLAPAAERAGCTVHSFKSPYDAGEFVLKQLKKGAVVLAKGSQNGVFTEEAVKILLEHPADSEKLVRQSPFWLKVKAKQFGR